MANECLDENHLCYFEQSSINSLLNQRVNILLSML